MGRGGATGGERGGGGLKPTLKHGSKVDLLGVGVTLFSCLLGTLTWQEGLRFPAPIAQIASPCTATMASSSGAASSAAPAASSAAPAASSAAPAAPVLRAPPADAATDFLAWVMSHDYLHAHLSDAASDRQWLLNTQTLFYLRNGPFTAPGTRGGRLLDLEWLQERRARAPAPPILTPAGSTQRQRSH